MCFLGLAVLTWHSTSAESSSNHTSNVVCWPKESNQHNIHQSLYIHIYQEKNLPKENTQKCLPPTVSGYFMGAASWSQSFDTLSHNDNGPARDVYAIDWPSWGLSGRENFPSQQGTDICHLESAFFGGGSESWNKIQGISDFIWFILFMLFVSVVATIPEVPVSFIFFLFAQIPCLCLSQSEATWRYHFYYFEY